MPMPMGGGMPQGPQGPQAPQDPMFQEQAPPIDDPAAVSMLNDEMYHAMDVPQDWVDANPEQMQTAPAAGEGYEGVTGVQEEYMQGGPEGMPEQPADAEGMRDTMIQRMGEESMGNDEFQDNVVDQNMMARKMR
jgi:hypothetical protein